MSLPNNHSANENGELHDELVMLVLCEERHDVASEE